MKSKRDVMQGRNIENDEYKGIYQKIVFLQMCDEEFPKLYIEYVCIDLSMPCNLMSSAHEKTWMIGGNYLIVLMI